MSFTRVLKHRLTYEKSYKRMAQAMERFRKCDNKKAKHQIKKEIALCKNFWKCYPLHYFRYDLYRKEKELSEKELINYVPEFFFYSLFLPFYNLKKYKILIEDKIISEQFFRSLNISQPHTICTVKSNHIYTNDMNKITYARVKQELVEQKYEKIFVKPKDGYGGHGIYVFNKKNSGQYLASDNILFGEDFLRKIGAKNDFIVQAGVEQDSEILKIYPYSVNTFRIITEYKNGNIRILCAILRFGRNGNQVDNADSGGIFVIVDVGKGTLGNYGISMEGEYFKKHPDTNIIFGEYKISRWNEIKEFVIESTKKLSYFTYLGWDIALTKNEPLAIETHSGFGLEALNLIFGGMREILRIDDPIYYWKNMGNRISGAY